MPANRTTSTTGDPARSVNRALAALREAAEHLEEARAASEQPNLSVAAALSHVAASRAALTSREVNVDRSASDQRAA